MDLQIFALGTEMAPSDIIELIILNGRLVVKTSLRFIGVLFGEGSDLHRWSSASLAIPRLASKISTLLEPEPIVEGVRKYLFSLLWLQIVSQFKEVVAGLIQNLWTKLPSGSSVSENGRLSSS